MKRRKRKRRKKTRGGEKNKNKKTYNPTKKKDNRKKKTKLKKEKRNDEGESEAEAPTKKTNTTNKNTEKLIRTMTKNSSTYCTRKVQSLSDRKRLVVKKGKSKKYQTIVLVFLKMYAKGRRMQRQIYRDRFVALTKITYFGPLGAKIAFCGLASLALRFQWFQRNFVDFGNTIILQKRGATPKNTKMMMGAAPEIYFGLFYETPILTFMLQIWDRQCKKKKNIFPAVLGIFAHCKKKRFHTLSNPEEDAIYKEQKCALNNLIFGMVAQDHARYFAHPRE